MKRPLVLIAVLALAAACGDEGPRVVVRAEIDGQPVADLPVRLLPYDRRAILDSLAEAMDLPEPGVSQDTVQKEDTVARDTGRVKPGADSAAARAAAPASPQARADSLRRARQAWLDTLSPRFEKAAEAKRGETGLVEQGDTTDAAGRAEMAAAEGEWWLSARYVLPDAELEWYVPVTLRGDSVVVRLDRRNARTSPVVF